MDKQPDWEKEWREILIRSLFSGEQVGIKRIFKLHPKRQCWIEWGHLEKVISDLLHHFISKEELAEKIKSKRHTRCMPAKDGRGCMHNEVLSDLLELIK